MTLETSQKQVANQHVQHDSNFRFKKKFYTWVKKDQESTLKCLTVVIFRWWKVMDDIYFLLYSCLNLLKSLIIFFSDNFLSREEWFFKKNSMTVYYKLY